MAGRTPWAAPPRGRPAAAAAALTSSQALARGLLRGADGWRAARRSASRGNLVGRLGLGRRSLALGKEVCGGQRAQPVRAGPAGVGAPSPPAPRSAAGQLCLRRRAMCCVSISPCPAAKPPGAAARLTPSAPRSPRPAAPREGLPRPGRGPCAQGAGARPPVPPAAARARRAPRGGDRARAQPRPARCGPFNATGGGGDPARPPRAREPGQPDKAGPGRGPSRTHRR